MDGYVELAVFAIAALLVPTLVLAFSRLIKPQDGLSRSEAPAGPAAADGERVQKFGMIDEYAHYSALFAAFLVVGVIVVVWSLFAKASDFASNLNIELLLVFGLVLGASALAIGRSGR